MDDDRAKGRDTQDEALLKAKVIKGEILILQEDVKQLLQYAIDAGGKLSRGITFKRNRSQEKFGGPPYDFIRTINVDVAPAAHGPYIRMFVQPLTRKLGVDKRYKPLAINSDLIGPVWKIF